MHVKGASGSRQTDMNDPGAHAAAKPDAFDLGKGQTTTPGTPCPTNSKESLSTV